MSFSRYRAGGSHAAASGSNGVGVAPRLWRSFGCFLCLGVCTLVLGSGTAPRIATGHEDGHEHPRRPKAVVLADAYRPSARPDRIVLTWNGDPRSTQSVTWRTSTEVSEAWAEIAIAEAGPGFAAKDKAQRVDAETQALATDLGTAHYHSVQFNKLSPGVKYAYRVGDGVNWSEWFHFETAKDTPEPFSFVYFGDAQNDIRSMWSRVIREAFRDAPRAKFLIHAGDLIDKAESDAQWGEWFGAGHWLNAMVPNVPVPGNHEMAKLPNGLRRLGHHWRPQFTLPEHGPPGLEETCYTFVYQNLRIVALNSNERYEEQARWLDEVLAANTSSWVACVFHHPIFSTAKERDNALLRAAWKPILDKYRVDIVLTGHDHTYGRTGLETPDNVVETTGNVPVGLQQRDPNSGTVYVVSVSGPKMYRLNRKPFMKRVAEETQLYQIIHIDGETLRFEARTAVGELYDAFELRKQKGKTNELREMVPATPERLRPPMPETSMTPERPENTGKAANAGPASAVDTAPAKALEKAPAKSTERVPANAPVTIPAEKPAP